MLSMITDRTQADVDRWRILRNKGWVGMTAGEKSEWAAGMKGADNASDLNRVQDAVRTLGKILTDYGYIVQQKAETLNRIWEHEDIPTVAQMQEYLENVRLILSVLPVTAEIPDSMNKLTYSGANDIEKALLAVEDAIHRMELAFIPCGEAICGGDNL